MSLQEKQSNRLTESQLIVNGLPFNKNYVVAGGPGSGKTLLALQRVERAKSSLLNELGREPRILFIVYNRPLQNLVKAVGSEYGLNQQDASTYHSWLWALYKEMFGSEPPQVAPYQHKWEAVERDLIKLNSEGKLFYDHVILDEAQDLPVALVEILLKISTSVCCFMDEQQRIDDSAGDTPRELTLTRETAIQLILAGDPYSQLTLTENHRNSQAIADFAAVFLPPGALAPRSTNSGGRKPEVMTYGDLDDFAKQVSLYAENNPDQSIAIFSPDIDIKGRIASAIEGCCPEGRKVREYIDSTVTRNFDVLDQKAIQLFTYRTHKGLEFDAVFLPELDSDYFNNETEVKKNQAMVGVTRASKRLFLGCRNYPNTSSFALRLIQGREGLVDISQLSNDDNHNEPLDFDDDIPF